MNKKDDKVKESGYKIILNDVYLYGGAPFQYIINTGNKSIFYTTGSPLAWEELGDYYFLSLQQSDVGFSLHFKNDYFSMYQVTLDTITLNSPDGSIGNYDNFDKEGIYDFTMYDNTTYVGTLQPIYTPW